MLGKVQSFNVRRLRVESVSDPTPDPYGQPGFSALTAYVDRDDPIANQLRNASVQKIAVKVRCATLEIEGHIGELQFAEDANERPIAINVDELRYYKPSRDLSVERKRLD
jgi:hypothetical protein